MAQAPKQVHPVRGSSSENSRKGFTLGQVIGYAAGGVALLGGGITIGLVSRSGTVSDLEGQLSAKEGIVQTQAADLEATTTELASTTKELAAAEKKLAAPQVHDPAKLHAHATVSYDALDGAVRDVMRGLPRNLPKEIRAAMKELMKDKEGVPIRLVPYEGVTYVVQKYEDDRGRARIGVFVPGANDENKNGVPDGNKWANAVYAGEVTRRIDGSVTVTFNNPYFGTSTLTREIEPAITVVQNSAPVFRSMVDQRQLDEDEAQRQRLIGERDQARSAYDALQRQMMGSRGTSPQGRMPRPYVQQRR